MESFSAFNVWGSVNIFAVLLLSLLLAHMLKKSVPFFQKSLIPTPVLGGIFLLIISTIYKAFTGVSIFDTPVFGGNGMEVMEVITYHALAFGFIASTLKTSNKQMTKKRTVEIFDSGVTTVATYLLQAVLGLGITIIFSLIIAGFFTAAGVLLPFGFGQGTGQALNFGSIYESMGFKGGRSFGLTVAALGFISASLGGVFHLHVLKKRGKIKFTSLDDKGIPDDEKEGANEIPVNGNLDRITFQITFILIAYGLSYLAMLGLSAIFPGMTATIFGFNFLFGALFSVLVKAVLKLLNKKKIVKKQYVNNFLLTRISNLCFDVMIVAGIAAIRLEAVKDYWLVLLILAIVGLVSTFAYNRAVAKTLFKDYAEEQFMVMYGMLTGTASTGIMLLREIDGEFKTPAADNLVYQQFPAIAFGFPIMLLANLAPERPYLTFGILIAFFIVMNVILFRSKIFKRKKVTSTVVSETVVTEDEKTE